MVVKEQKDRILATLQNSISCMEPVVISQTEACRAIHAEMRRRLDNQNAEIVRGLSPEEIADLNRLLDVLLKNIQE